MQDWEARAIARMKANRDQLMDEFVDQMFADALEIAKDEAPVDPGPGPDPDPDTKIYFEIVDHHNMPDLRQFGFEPLKIYYAGAFFDEKDDRDETNRVSFQDINLDKVAEHARGAPLISCPDVERWANKDTWQVPDENVARYIEMCETWLLNLPSEDHQFGIYSILPVRNYWDATSGNASRYKKWQRWNDQVAPIAAHVDMLFPSLYAFSSVFEDKADRLHKWELYAVENIKEARRIAPDKPIYPYLWPWYHPSAETPIEAEFWTHKLDVCKEHADGWVMWDDETSTKMDFGDLPPYWNATVKWLERNT